LTAEHARRTMAPELGGVMAVGRRAERAALATFLGDAAAGPSAALIEGEPGIGKSTLWAEGIELAEARGCRVLSCRPSGSDAELSLVGLHDLLRAVPDEVLAGLSEPQRDALEVALLRRPSAGRRPDPRAVSVASLGLLEALARVGPLVLAIDDEPWIDGATERVLTFVARRLGEVPVCFLVARPDPDAPIPLGLADAIAPGRLRRFPLGPLPPEELAALVRERVGLSMSVPEARRLEEVSGGIPFYALEIAQAMARGDEGVTGQSLPIPRNLREDLVMQRLGTIPAGSLDLLLVAAASARPTLDLLSAATGPERMPRRLQGAIDAGLVGVVGSHVRFTHPLYRSVLYANASRARRHAVHRRLAELTADLEERARHLALSAEGSDEANASILDDAAVMARDRGAPDAAAELLEHAIRLTPSTSGRARRRRYLLASGERFVAGDPTTAERHARDALVLSSPGAERAEALRRVAELEVERGAMVAARRSLEGAAAEPDVDATTAAAVRCDLAELIARSGDLAEAERYARSAEEGARRAGDRGIELAARVTRSRIDLLRGEATTLLAGESTADSGATPAGVDPLGLVLAEAEIVCGRHEDARTRLEALHAAAAERGDEPNRRAVLLRLAELELRDGSWDRASSLAHEALALAGLFGLEGARETALLAYVAAARGDEDDCRSAARAGLGAAADDRPALLWSLGALGLLELSLGQAEMAVRHLGRAGGITTEMRLGEPAWLSFLGDEAEALVVAGDHQAAARRIEWLEDRGRALGRESAIAAALRCRALLFADTGRLAEALACAASAVEASEPVPLPFERGRAALVLGILRRRDRQKRDAREALERAQKTFESLGARLWAERARAEIDRISGRRASLTELTESEERIVRLAAAGRTNQEIARTLSMSVRTVEGHLSHVYAKLGLRSRTELAVFFQTSD
jgi:DNA-binding CsgD family transcriptional regulator